jgi:hypothetical protein
MDSRGVTHRFLLTLANEISEALPQPEGLPAHGTRGWGRSSVAPLLHAFLVHVLTTFRSAKGDVVCHRVHVVMANRAFAVDRLADFL